MTHLHKLRGGVALCALLAMPATAADWVTNYGPVGYNGWSGSITFNDWGYTGPMGVGANDFEVNGGFDPNRIGQIQSVVTVAPDYNTPDPTHNVSGDLSSSVGGGTPITNANMDGSVNFFDWAYTTPTSSFNNMKIDKAGNYFVAKSDMNFGFYDTFAYRNEGPDNPNVPGATTGSTVNIDTGINFQPYAISDAIGWCGSTLVENPNGVEYMAGQVKFDFAFDAYLSDGLPGGYALTQIVPDFVMRSYGDYVITSNKNNVSLTYTGSAVVNNTNPLTGELDPNYQNNVSFLGGGVVPEGAWVLNEGTPDVEVVAAGTEGAVWHANVFAGYAFLLRADAERTLVWIAPDGHSDYVATAVTPEVPVPAAAWLFGSGLLGLLGFAGKKRNA